MAKPELRIPLTDVTGTMFTRQSRYDICRDFEMRFVECSEAYGVQKGYLMCTDYYEDFKECRTKALQYKRVNAMRAERHRQYKKGERAVEFEPDPRQDVFNHGKS